MAEFQTLGEAARRVVNGIQVMRITKPGAYPDIPSSAYFNDPCPDPSLTQSLVKTILARSPWHARTQHPRLNPHYQADGSSRFDIGNAAHQILLGRGKGLAVVNADDWRTKLAQQAREAALADGKTVVLAHQYDQAGEMVHSARLQLDGRFGLADLFDDGGHAEIMLAWQDHGIWLRTLIDWLSPDRRRVIDYKTTQASAAPSAVAMKMATDGWAIQAAFHENGLDVLDPLTAGRREHLFVCQECEPPYALSVSRIRQAPRTIGRRQVAYAIERWRKCLLSDKWDGYEGVVEPEYPGHLEARWLEAEISYSEAGVVPSDILSAG